MAVRLLIGLIELAKLVKLLNAILAGLIVRLVVKAAIDIAGAINIIYIAKKNFFLKDILKILIFNFANKREVLLSYYCCYCY